MRDEPVKLTENWELYINDEGEIFVAHILDGNRHILYLGETDHLNINDLHEGVNMIRSQGTSIHDLN